MRLIRDLRLAEDGVEDKLIGEVREFFDGIMEIEILGGPRMTCDGYH
jgi:hypothetical protein